MNREVSVNSPDFELPPEFAFMSPDALSALRDTQSEELSRVGAQAIREANIFESGEAYDSARQVVANQNTESAQKYVAQYMSRENKPELFDALVGVVADSSVHRMDSQDWYLGTSDANGNFVQPETSGRYKLEQRLQELDLTVTSNPGSNPVNPDEALDLSNTQTTPEILQGRERLDMARENLAKLSMERRRKLHNSGKKNKALEKRFDDANQEYQAAHTGLVAMGIKQQREQGASEDSLQQAAIKAVIKEHGRFTESERQILDQDSGKRATLARFWAKSHRRFFTSTLGAGGVAGFGARALLRTTIGVATATGAVIGIGAALGTSKAALTSTIGLRAHQLTERQARADSDGKLLQLKLAREIDASTTEEAFHEHVQHLHDVIADRVGHDRHYNQQRVVAAALSGAIGGATGGLVGGWAGEWATNHLFSGAGEWVTNHLFGGAGHTIQPPTSFGPQPPAHAPYTTIHARHDIQLSHNHTDGFNNNVNVEYGHGYTTELQELAAQKNIHLNGVESFQLYQDLTGKLGGHLFTNDASYHMPGHNYGISHPGQAHWNPAAIHEMQRWLEENDKIAA